jgi:hypothetical protein
VDKELLAARRRIALLEARLETAETINVALRIRRPGVGDDQQRLLTRLTDLWGVLDRAADPTRGRVYGTINRHPAAGSSDEGAPTRKWRYLKADLNRRIHQAIEDTLDRIDGTWTPAPKCPRCNRSQRRSARRCDRCGTRLGQTTDITRKPLSDNASDGDTGQELAE